MAQTWTCTINYNDLGEGLPTWSPTTPTLETFGIGDTVVFQSPAGPTTIHFLTDSPFGPTPGEKTYDVPKGVSQTTEPVNARATGNIYHFECQPNGVIVEGGGGDVPVGS